MKKETISSRFHKKLHIEDMMVWFRIAGMYITLNGNQK